MTRYFFNVHDGADLPDEEGVELPDWRAAQLEALRLAGNLIADNAKQMKLGEDWSMVVTDETDLILFRLDFHISGSPAVLQAQPLAKSAP